MYNSWISNTLSVFPYLLCTFVHCFVVHNIVHLPLWHAKRNTLQKIWTDLPQCAESPQKKKDTPLNKTLTFSFSNSVQYLWRQSVHLIHSIPCGNKAAKTSEEKSGHLILDVDNRLGRKLNTKACHFSPEKVNFRKRGFLFAFSFLILQRTACLFVLFQQKHFKICFKFVWPDLFECSHTDCSVVCVAVSCRIPKRWQTMDCQLYDSQHKHAEYDCLFVIPRRNFCMSTSFGKIHVYLANYGKLLRCGHQCLWKNLGQCLSRLYFLAKKHPQLFGGLYRIVWDQKLLEWTLKPPSHQTSASTNGSPAF